MIAEWEQFDGAVGLRAHIGSGYRVKGEVGAALGDVQRADEDFRRAIDILAAVKNEVELAAYQGLAGIRSGRERSPTRRSSADVRPTFSSVYAAPPLRNNPRLPDTARVCRGNRKGQ